MRPVESQNPDHSISEVLRHMLLVRRQSIRSISPYLPHPREARLEAESLDQGDGNRTGRLLRMPGLTDQVPGNHAVDDAEHPADQLGVRGQ